MIGSKCVGEVQQHVAGSGDLVLSICCKQTRAVSV